MAPRRNRSISGPIIYGSASVALTVALLVGWIYVILRNQELTQQWVGNLWLLVSGIVSFVTIMSVLILFSVNLARQILEVRRQTTFVDSVTHELRSPLASIRLGLETMGREGLAEPQRDKLRDMMLGDVERLSGFIDDVIEATRLEGGRESHALSRVDVGALALRCADTIAARHEVARNTIDVDVDPDLVLQTDPTSLEIIIKNLLDNAVKYSDRPPRVRMRARVEEEKVVLTVVDDGVGIPRRDLKRVFRRFYRVDEEAVRARRGTGLGLYVVRALVKTLGGKLVAASDGPGAGTTMTVALPRRPQHRPAAPAEAIDAAE